MATKIEATSPEETRKFELPKEVHELPKRFEDLLNEWNTFKDTVVKTVEPLKKLIPEEKVPCPTCGSEIPKSKLPAVEQKAKELYGKVEHVVVPKEVEKRVEVPKPEVPVEEFRKTVLEVFPERPDGKIEEAIRKIADQAVKRGWLKP
jgi:hypothetical protein